MTLAIDYELRPLAECRMTKMGHRLALGFTALSDGALAIASDRGEPLLPSSSLGWPGKRLSAPDVHLLTVFDDLVSVLALQVRPTSIPEALGGGAAVAILERYESLMAATDDEAEDLPDQVLTAGDYLVTRSVYLPGDCRLLVLARDGEVELACEGQQTSAPRDEFLGALTRTLDSFLKRMRERVEESAMLNDHPGAVGVDELRKQGQQWHRRLEALLRRTAGEKFAPLAWPW